MKRKCEMSKTISVDLYKSKIATTTKEEVLEEHLIEISNHFLGRIEEIRIEYADFLKTCLLPLYKDEEEFITHYKELVDVSDESLWKHEIYELMFEIHRDNLADAEYTGDINW